MSSRTPHHIIATWDHHTMASRNIDEPAFHKLVDAIREYIEWKLPIELTEDELTCIDDSVVLMLRDLFTVAPPTS